jgi:2-polyprenyl-6-methoxyphenol hydroxylase-like FAD-dependent oxidoreductase
MSPAAKSVLISGSSIAGPALAHWLEREGFAVTLLERGATQRQGGQAIDLRGPAIDVVERMGILDEVRKHKTNMTGMSAMGIDGQELWRNETMTYTGGSFDSTDIEILRDELAALLLGTLSPRAELIYGDSVTALREDADGVLVDFEKGPARRFDLVVGADGIHSNIRNLVFGSEAQFIRSLDVGLSVHTAPNSLGLNRWQITHEVDGRNCLIYTVRNDAELRICFTFPATIEDEHLGDLDAQRALVAGQAGHLGWEVPNLIPTIFAAPDFYFGVMSQILMPHWTKGRVALVGDAGYCPSPFTGQGTSLAIVGAYILAHELGRHGDDHGAAFAVYEQRMRPFVEKNQAIAPIARDIDFGDPESQHVMLNLLSEAKVAIQLDAHA